MTTNEILHATITAYCACQLCCGAGAQGITASGLKPRPAHTIAARRSIPFGSVVILGGTNRYVVEDRLARRYDSRFDIYFASHKAALAFGKQTNNVLVITK